MKDTFQKLGNTRAAVKVMNRVRKMNNKVSKCKNCTAIFTKEFGTQFSFFKEGDSKTDMNDKGTELYNLVCDDCKPYVTKMLKGLEHM